MNKILERLKQEFLGVIPTAVFFFIAFQLLAFTRDLIVQEYDVEISTFLAATVGALIVAKIVMVVDLLPFVNRFPDKPLIYNIVWKTSIYLVAAFLFRYIEYLVPFVLDYGDIAEANRHLLDEAVWPHFFIVQIWLFVLFFLYCVVTELVRVLGHDRVRSMFLGADRL